MAKEYIGSQEHFEDEINAYYEQKEEMEREMQKQYEKDMMEEMEKIKAEIVADNLSPGVNHIINIK